MRTEAADYQILLLVTVTMAAAVKQLERDQ
jgi:hypothetical protein